MKEYKLDKNRILSQPNYMDPEDLYQLRLIKRHMATKKNKKDLLDLDFEADFV
ncbi:hypothetical protein GF371_05385 [Candidatus Woesearchaeota archaeon]|nr:hypothetical protein [Candidatus Woesearchaeota archaeon]